MIEFNIRLAPTGNTQWNIEFESVLYNTTVLLHVIMILSNVEKAH